jgi:hypothetical protein
MHSPQSLSHLRQGRLRQRYLLAVAAVSVPLAPQGYSPKAASGGEGNRVPTGRTCRR